MKPAAREKLKGELLSLASDHKKTEGIRDVLFHPKFPVDIRHNAKIGRPELSRWAAKKLGLPVRARKVPVS